MLFSLGVLLFGIALLLLGWALLLNRRSQPPRWLSIGGDYYALVVIILLTMGATLGIRELAAGQVNVTQAGLGAVIAALCYGAWQLLRQGGHKGMARVSGDTVVPDGLSTRSGLPPTA